MAVVNATDQEQKFDLSLSGMHLSGAATAWQLTGSSLDAANHVGQAAQVTTKEISMDATPGTISAAPISVTVYRLSLVQ